MKNITRGGKQGNSSPRKTHWQPLETRVWLSKYWFPHSSIYQWICTLRWCLIILSFRLNNHFFFFFTHSSVAAVESSSSFWIRSEQSIILESASHSVFMRIEDGTIINTYLFKAAEEDIKKVNWITINIKKDIWLYIFFYIRDFVFCSPYLLLGLNIKFIFNLSFSHLFSCCFFFGMLCIFVPERNFHLVDHSIF